MKRIFSFFAVLFVCAGLFSCASSPASRQGGSSVWKISSNDNTLFLGGSVHILRDTDFPLPKEFDAAFAQSDVLVLEADIEQMADETIMQYLMSRMFLPGGQTLQSILDTETYEMLEAECNQYGVSLSMEEISRFKPSMIITMLTMLQVQESGFVQQGVDEYYLNRAKEANKPLVFLETVETQIDALVTMGDGYENDYVRYSLLDMESTEQELAALLAEWKDGTASITESASLEMREKWPAIYKTLLTDRNTAWMPQIEEYLASGQVYFVIAGLMHLHGPDGLLRQLEEAGYYAQQLK